MPSGSRQLLADVDGQSSGGLVLVSGVSIFTLYYSAYGDMYMSYRYIYRYDMYISPYAIPIRHDETCGLFARDVSGAGLSHVDGWRRFTARQLRLLR